MNEKQFVYLFLRYILLIIIAIPNLYLIYLIASPLTIYAVYGLLQLIYEPVLLYNKIIQFSGISIILINACIAGAAYYLLLILNLTTSMPLKKRIKSLVFILFLFYLFNVLRIVIFSILFSKGYANVDFAHDLVWHIGSTILLVLIWFANIFVFKIKKIPIYSDLVFLSKHINNSKTKRNRSK